MGVDFSSSLIYGVEITKDEYDFLHRLPRYEDGKNSFYWDSYVFRTNAYTNEFGEYYFGIPIGSIDAGYGVAVSINEEFTKNLWAGLIDRLQPKFKNNKPTYWLLNIIQ